MSGAEPRKPGPEPEMLRIEGPWEKAIDKALSKKRPIGGFPKPPSRTVRPKRVPPPLKPERVRVNPAPSALSPDPIEVAAKRRRPTKSEVQAEMLRAHCTRSEAIVRLKARRASNGAA